MSLKSVTAPPSLRCCSDPQHWLTGQEKPIPALGERGKEDGREREGERERGGRGQERKRERRGRRKRGREREMGRE